MIKFFSIVLTTCLISATSVCAQDAFSEQMLQDEFLQNNEKINEIFQDKIKKISARTALPDEIKKLLISQADEIRQFDLEMLKKKMDMKLRHAKERDEMKETLRKDAQNRVKWMMEDEARFQNNKQKRQSDEKNIIKKVTENKNAVQPQKAPVPVVSTQPLSSSVKNDTPENSLKTSSDEPIENNVHN